MAVGAPDFFGQSVWPSYGSLLVLEVAAIDLPAGAYTTVGKIEVQGIIVAAILHIDTAEPVELYPHIIVDDETIISGYHINDYRDYGLLAPARLPLVLLDYDPLVAWFTFSVGIELPFRYTFEIGVTNTSDNPYLAHLRLYYYNII